MKKWTVTGVKQQSKVDNWSLMSEWSSHLLGFWPLKAGLCLFKFVVPSMLLVHLASIHKY